MKSKNILYIIASALLLTAACHPSIETPAPSKGRADFSRYIAIGNSLTAGYEDGGLYLEGQKNSYPEILAGQMKAAGGGEFKTPFFSEEQSNGSGYLRITGFNADGTPIISAVTDKLAVRGHVNIPPVGDIILYTKYTGDINNYGVPGIKLQQITTGAYANFNGYFERLLPGNAGTLNMAYLDFVTAKPFTFFSMWLGSNDALGYATSGGVGDVLTDKPTFSALYNAAVVKMTEGGAKGVVATIPDVTSIPFFTTVTYAALLAGAQKINPAVQAIYIRTDDAPGGVRPATSQDLFTLTLNSDGVFGKPNTSGIPYGLHPLNPIDSKYVLDKTETAIVKDYVTSYNAIIKSAASAKGLAVMDAYTVLNEFKNGKIVSGITVNSSFVTGNLFSLDGVHLTPLGYALVANEFIKAINEQYGSSLSTVDVTRYRSVIFPNKQ